jgi:hypothetical protein
MDADTQGLALLGFYNVADLVEISVATLAKPCSLLLAYYFINPALPDPPLFRRNPSLIIMRI